MVPFASTLKKIKNEYVKLISNHDFYFLVSASISSFTLTKAICYLCGPFIGLRFCLLSFYFFISGRNDCQEDLENFLVIPSYIWYKAKDFLMYSTKKPIFNIYYGVQLLLQKFDIQPYSSRKFVRTQFCFDLKDICLNSVENLKFVLKHDILLLINDDKLLEDIGEIMVLKSFSLVSYDCLNEETTMLLLKELEKKLDKRGFERILYGFLRSSIYKNSNLQHMFYLICNTFGDNYNIFEGSHGIIIIHCMSFNDFKMFEFLLTKKKQQNLNARIVFVYSYYAYDNTPYGYALYENKKKERAMLFIHGATPCVPTYHDSDKEKSKLIIQEDLLHGLLYCLEHKNVLVIFD
jgi:hypothetical protein